MITHSRRATLLLAILVACVVVPAGQDGVPGAGDAAPFSPLGFQDLHAYELAFPVQAGSELVRQAVTNRYWVFRGIAMRGSGDAEGMAWTSLGPESAVSATSSEENFAGRVAALAISPACSRQGTCRMWVGAAGGGVWRTDDALNTQDPAWRWVSAGLGTNSIGSLTVDPNDRTGNTIYVGTGETNQPNNSGAGTGLYKSPDGGDHWTRMPTMVVDRAVSPSAIDFTATRGISTVVVEPGNSQTMYVATTSAMLGMTGVRGGQTQTTGYPQPRVGLYKTDNAGVTWTLLWVPPLDPVVPANPNIGIGVGDTMFGVRHVKLDPRNPKVVYASAWNNAIHRSAPTLEGGDGAFKPVFAIVGLQRFRDLAMFDLTVRNGHTRMYVYNGTDNLNEQALYRLDDADVRASSLVTYDSAGALVNSRSWLKLTSSDAASASSVSRRLCQAQCFYDLVVAVPPGKPDTVYIAGVATTTFGDPTIRSTDGGVTFTSFGADAGNPRTSSHVDVRAIVFHPQVPEIVFVGSDGGIVRNDGSFVDISNRCAQLYPSATPCRSVLSSVPAHLHFMNRGLQTTQFYNVSIDPRAPLTRLIGGLQDNGTIWRDGTGEPRVWKDFFAFGDGTSASGFHPTRAEVTFASFQSNRFFANFRNADPVRWVRTDDPIRLAGERASITQSTGRQFLTFDVARPDSQFTAFQHVWRTQNNGGPQAFLEANCRYPSGAVAGASCGDWVPLGVPYPFALGSTAESSSRRPGDLTSTFYGSDRTGGLIVAAERTVADGGTLWAATNKGRLFIARNADGPAAGVEFVRLDTASTPMRFITRIVADRANPNVALVSYSGFNALTPSTPGHVFRVVYDPRTQSAAFTALDFDLGDMPINTLAYDDLRGDLYAGTDFGPLVLPRGSSQWQVAGVGFPEALIVDLEIAPDQRVLVGATHGLGVFYMNLPPGVGM